MPPCVPQDDWPQWRGVDGLGVSSDTDLPTELGPSSPELLWRAAVPGDGISSPIVQDGRVFLTTTYPGEPGIGMVLLRAGLVAACALALLLLLARRSREPRALPGLGRLVAALDALYLSSGTFVFAAGAYAVGFHSELLWESGSPGLRWFYSSALALGGTAVALAWMRPGSPARLAGMLVVLAAAWVLFRRTPLNQYSDPYRLLVRLAMVAPALVGGAWHVLAFCLARAATARRGPIVSLVGASALALAAVLSFLLANHVALSSGVVRAVVCYDLDSGDQLWLTALFTAREATKYDGNSHATPTACATPEVVFAHFGSGYGVVDHAGRVRASVIDEHYPERTRYGASSSPILVGNSVVYLHDKELDLGPSTLTRLDLPEGAVRWHRETQRTHNSYTTPLLVERGGVQELLTVTFDRIVAFDPEDGQELWTHPVSIEQMVPSLQVRNDLLLVSGGAHRDASTNAVRLSGSGRGTRAEIVWQTRRAVPAVASPVLVGDAYFTITDGGILTCFEPETGAIRWQERLGGTYWSSLVAGDGKIYALDQDGIATTLGAGHRFEVLAKGDFASRCRATPAIAGGRVLVRTENELYCFGARR